MHYNFHRFCTGTNGTFHDFVVGSVCHMLVGSIMYLLSGSETGRQTLNLYYLVNGWDLLSEMLWEVDLLKFLKVRRQQEGHEHDKCWLWWRSVVVDVPLAASLGFYNIRMSVVIVDVPLAASLGFYNNMRKSVIFVDVPLAASLGFYNMRKSVTFVDVPLAASLGFYTRSALFVDVPLKELQHSIIDHSSQC